MMHRCPMCSAYGETRAELDQHIREMHPDSMKGIPVTYVTMTGLPMSGAALPALLDAKKLREELGLGRVAADHLLDALPTIKIGRKRYVRRTLVERHLEKTERKGVA